MHWSRLATKHQLYEQPSDGKPQEELYFRVLLGLLTAAVVSQYALQLAPC